MRLSFSFLFLILIFLDVATALPPVLNGVDWQLLVKPAQLPRDRPARRHQQELVAELVPVLRPPLDRKEAQVRRGSVPLDGAAEEDEDRRRSGGGRGSFLVVSAAAAPSRLAALILLLANDGSATTTLSSSSQQPHRHRRLLQALGRKVRRVRDHGVERADERRLDPARPPVVVVTKAPS